MKNAAKALRAILLALLASLVTGLAIGTWIRLRFEPQPERYFLGRAAEGEAEAVAEGEAEGEPAPPLWASAK